MGQVLDKRELRREVFTVRPPSTEKQALRIIVIQRLNDDDEVSVPTITIIGSIDSYIKSPRYAIDLAANIIAAAIQVQKWTKYVK